MTKKSKILNFSTVLSVDTDSYLEFSDALVCIDENEEVYTLPGKFEAPDPSKDKLEQLVINVLCFSWGWGGQT